jgi:hypothetical protein
MRVWLAAEWNIGIRFSKMRLFSTEFPYRKETFRPVSRNRFPRRGPRKNGSAYLIRYFRFLFAEFRVYDEGGNLVETHEHAGEFQEW